MADTKRDEQGIHLLDRCCPARNIEEEMKLPPSIIAPAKSVIVGRRCPMCATAFQCRCTEPHPLHHGRWARPQQAYKKSARVVEGRRGQTTPTATAPYDAVVRMVQDFSLRHPLVDGQGNFGSIDADPPAAMRYRGGPPRAIAQEMLGDIDKNTVDFGPNYDGSLTEPWCCPRSCPTC